MCFSRLVQKRILFRSVVTPCMGTDEECDHYLSLFGRAQGAPVCIFFGESFQKFTLYLLQVTLQIDAEQYTLLL